VHLLETRKDLSTTSLISVACTTEFYVKQNIVLSKVYNVYLKQFSISIILKEIRGRGLSVLSHIPAKQKLFCVLLCPNVKVVIMIENTSSKIGLSNSTEQSAA